MYVLQLDTLCKHFILIFQTHFVDFLTAGKPLWLKLMKIFVPIGNLFFILSMLPNCNGTHYLISSCKSCFRDLDAVTHDGVFRDIGRVRSLHRDRQFCHMHRCTGKVIRFLIISYTNFDLYLVQGN